MSEWVDAEQRIERAQQLCERRRYDEALVQISKALEIQPDNASWWNSKAYLLDQLQRYEEAIEAYRRSLQLEPDHRDLLTFLGVDYIRTGQLLAALEVFERVARIDPNYEPAFCHRILLYAELGDHDRAEEMFYSAQLLDESCPHCFWHLGCSRWVRGDYQRAIFCWSRVLEIEPQYRGARRRIATAYRRLGDVELARQYYLAEYRQDPRQIECLLELGEMLFDHGHLGEAITKFRQVIELDPHHVRAHLLLGDALGSAGEDEAAMRTHRALATMAPDVPGVNYRLGSRLMKLGRYLEARHALAAELSLQPDDRSTLMAAGNCAIELGDTEAATGYFQRLIEIDDCVPAAHHNLGVCYFLRREYEAGIRHCLSALSLREDYALARHKVVLGCLAVGRLRQARQFLAEGLALDPRDVLLRRLRWRCRLMGLASWCRNRLRFASCPAGTRIGTASNE